MKLLSSIVLVAVVNFNGMLIAGGGASKSYVPQPSTDLQAVLIAARRSNSQLLYLPTRALIEEAELYPDRTVGIIALSLSAESAPYFTHEKWFVLEELELLSGNPEHLPVGLHECQTIKILRVRIDAFKTAAEENFMLPHSLTCIEVWGNSTECNCAIPFFSTDEERNAYEESLPEFYRKQTFYKNDLKQMGFVFMSK